MNLKVGYLYADYMNIYGDTGNITALQNRCEWRGIGVKVRNISINDDLKKGDVDLYFFGGGQDQSQKLVAEDLINKKGKILQREVERGVPLLSVCGGYQLLGEYYLPQNAPKLGGIGIFPIYTKAGNTRMIGNLVIETEEFGKLVGFENHSGRTYFQKNGKALGSVIKGFGNNGEDRTEGCIYKNAIGCYLHGSLLPKNPKMADWLIKKALELKYGKIIELEALDDELETKAHDFAIQKFG